jgi:hypothetical protein
VEKTMSLPTSLTPQQKLLCFRHRFYDMQKWEPKAGDYYTSTRDDLELYLIAREDDDFFYTVYATNPNGIESQWPKTEFTSVGFGMMRMYVPFHVFTMGTPDGH